MHVTGKILVFLLLVASGVAFVWTARLVDRRGQWLRDYQKAKAQNENTANDLAAAREERDSARGDLEREMLRWDRYWSDVTAGFDPQSSSIIAGIGSAKGFSPTTTPTLFAFQLGKDGTPSYVGPFTVAQVQANESTLRPAFRVRPDDAAKWTGQNWRFRTMIPSSSVARIAGLQTDLVVADELLAKQQGNLEVQTQLVQAAKEQREDRIGELLGGRKANPNEPGLNAQIAKAEDVRNESLAGVDSLRRTVREAMINVRRLIQENNELARALQAQASSKATASR